MGLDNIQHYRCRGVSCGNRSDVQVARQTPITPKETLDMHKSFRDLHAAEPDVVSSTSVTLFSLECKVTVQRNP